MLDDDDFAAEFDRKTPMQRYGLPVGGALAIVGVGLAVFFVLKGGSSPAAKPHQEPHITQVQLPPPPPPPPPPKVPPPPQKMTETPKMREPTPAKAVSKPAPKAPSPPAQLQTSIAGNGPSSLGVGNGGGGGLCVGSDCGSGDGTGGDNDAYYSDLVKSRVQEALRRDRKLEFAKFRVTLSFKLDSAGGFADPSIASFSGDDDARAEVERVIRAVSTGDAPAASIVGKQFSIRIDSHARG